MLGMSIQQVVQSRPSSNGFGCREVEREYSATCLDSKLPSGKSNSVSSSNAGSLNGKVETFEDPSRYRFIYMTTCLIGHPVEVQIMDGSIYSGIFYATSADEEFGVVLKMARLIKDVPFKVQKLAIDSVGKGLTKIMIIPAKELVQVIAKDVAVTGNEMINSVQHEKCQDIMIDSYISQGFVEAERKLERWAPDEDDPQCPELENIFDGPWNR
ncbi:Polyadenylate-binding protein-interacting protein [Thalictrum thalictroides]|uniref:Polyadenylate-binding protein-interacting protein n=1 Tax=Thalictrum thalictroides TaxID=46969 RepID=A0A7J6WNA0_THATH|nr:Polyadenylate-binding protein-interacting protein [Thalictrum thalictroides]